MSRKDTFNKARVKSRYILEVRYPPLVQTFDRRGKILEKIFPEFQRKAEHWKVENVQVIMTDNLEKGKKQLAINHMKCSISYEDPSSQSEFIDDCNKFIRLFYEVFPEMQALKRIGFRAISIFNHKSAKSYNEVFDSIKKNFLCQKLPSSLCFTDCSLILSHDTCTARIGPVKEGEDWIKGIFVYPDSNIPGFGIGLDIDSFTKDLACPNSQELIKAFNAVSDLTFNIESEFLADLV
ncbi:MAG: hypothetical protein JW902_01920 [Syntrophaceae bacterium]|nr:hypothetical protein [Syntrophaceae bacterium]